MTKVALRAAGPQTSREANKFCLKCGIFEKNSMLRLESRSNWMKCLQCDLQDPRQDFCIVLDIFCLIVLSDLKTRRCSGNQHQCTVIPGLVLLTSSSPTSSHHPPRPTALWDINSVRWPESQFQLNSTANTRVTQRLGISRGQLPRTGISDVSHGVFY